MGFRSPTKASQNPSAKHMSFRRLCTQAYKSHSSQCCGVKLIEAQCKTVAITILHVRELCGHKTCREFLVKPIVVHMK